MERSFLLPFASLGSRRRGRDPAFCKSALQPAAIDLLNPAAARDRGQRHLAAGDARWAAMRPPSTATSASSRALPDSVALDDDRQETLWRHVENFTPRLPGRHRGWRGGARFVYAEGTGSSDGVVPEVRRSRAPARASVTAISNTSQPPRSGWPKAVARGWKAVIEFAPEARKTQAGVVAGAGRRS